MVIQPMTEEIAKRIQTWQYEEPYSLYSLKGDPDVFSELMNGSYAFVEDNDALIGYFCFGSSAQVPAGHEVNAYSDPMLDLGLGLHPKHTGKGIGLCFVQAGLDYAYKTYGQKNVRLSVASFNKRAKKVYERAGFSYLRSFTKTNKKSSTTFEIMVKRYEVE